MPAQSNPVYYSTSCKDRLIFIAACREYLTPKKWPKPAKRPGGGGHRGRTKRFCYWLSALVRRKRTMGTRPATSAMTQPMGMDIQMPVAPSAGMADSA